MLSSARFTSVFAITFVLAMCAHAGTINFDVDAVGNPITAPPIFADTTALSNQYASLGVLFSGSDPGQGGAILNASTFGRPARSGQNILAFNPTVGYPSFPGTITFINPASYVEIWMAGSSDIDTVVMTAYNSLNNAIGNATVSTQDWAKLSITATGISSVVLTRTSGGGGTEFDDLSFTTASDPVPEPATGLMLLGGLGLLGLGKRLLG